MFFEHKKSCRILDFGCGLGSVVQAGQSLGINLYGTDTFYDGMTWFLDEAKKGELFGTKIFLSNNNQLAFEDSFFDLVMANMVFEHVKDLPQILQEIWRVLQPGGYLLTLFPTKEAIYEGHTGIPMVQRFKRKSRIRFHYALMVRSLLTRKFNFRSNQTWVRDNLQWLDRYTNLRSQREMVKEISKYFTITLLENNFVMYRLKNSPRLNKFVKLLRPSFLQGLIRWIYQRVFGLVILAKKEIRSK